MEVLDTLNSPMSTFAYCKKNKINVILHLRKHAVLSICCAIFDLLETHGGSQCRAREGLLHGLAQHYNMERDCGQVEK